ncbi:MAG: carnitine dehydratase [Rhodospirillaceae bacterium]|nr:carnitine dehydratase [Rhodospirillaceae bacterium]
MFEATPTPSLSQQALAEILDAVSWEGRASDTLAFSGDDPQLPSTFRLATAGAAVLGAVGLAADALWRLKTGRTQDIAVDLRAAALAMRSNRHVRVGTAGFGAAWADISGLYRCADGRWVQLHCNYPWLAEGILDILGCSSDRAAVTAALGTWDAAAFEAAVAERNLCAFMVRSKDEWAAHPQGEAVAGLPLMSIEKIGDAPAEPMPTGDRPLSGIRALELVRVIAGPVCGRTLAEHGAQVMRIGRPDRPDDDSLLRDTGHGKLAANLDLRDPGAPDTLDALIKQADVVTQGHRPGTLAGRGLAPERLADLRPGIVFVSLSAWGHEGPWAHRRGFDSLAQCAMGIAAEHGGLDTPRHLPAQALDYVSGYLAAFGAMEALRRRATIGGSWLVRLSLAQSGHWIDHLGRVSDDAAKQRTEPGYDDVKDLMEIHDTAWGPMEHLKPVVRMSETPPRWDLPAAPLGTHPPAWPT